MANNNKGFTLVELLAVMVILISISLVAVIAVTDSLARREGKELEEQKELAVDAAKIFFSLNDVTCVKISTLKARNYISENQKIDSLDMDWTIKLVGDEYVYSDASC